MDRVRNRLTFRGVNYDVGMYFGQFRTGAFELSRATVTRDFLAIRDRLHCNSILIYGSDPDRIALGASIALELGMNIWIEPRLVDGSPAAVREQLREVAVIGQRYLDQGGDVTLVVGCELSIFVPGMIPGEGFQERIAALRQYNGDFSEPNRTLDTYLGDLAGVARKCFRGRITYAAAPWEAPDWSCFDLIGLNHYRMALNRDSYVASLRYHCQSGKPVVITEFGCCTYRGAEDLGPAGYDVIDWTSQPPQVRGEIVRDERVQAEYLRDLLDIFCREQVHGSFVYTFNNTDLLHASETRRDLDLASFGIVKTVSAIDSGSYEWMEKSAFGVVAGVYAPMTDA